MKKKVWESPPQADLRRAKVFLNSDWGEYVVRFYFKSDLPYADYDYFTTDLQDAIDTAKAELARHYKGETL